MDLGLKGLKAIVTGGKGHGRATQTLAAEGTHVTFCAQRRRGGADREGLRQPRRAGAGPRGRRRRRRRCPPRGRRGHLRWIDIVVANVSALAVGNDEAGWKSGFDVDMMGTVRLVNGAMPSLEQSAHAAIVTISSVSGRSRLRLAPYGAIKAAIIHYTQGLAYHLAGQKTAPTLCRRATPISRAACGSRSSTAPTFKMALA
jgi:3-oxoacyl-[acyl-carrier protein] reductase